MSITIPTLQEKIESYVGSISNIILLDKWLTDGARLVIDILPDYKLAPYKKTQTFDDGGYTIRDKRLFEVIRGSYKCSYINPAMVGKVILTNSIHAASARTPVFTIESSKVYVYPTVLNVSYGMAYYIDYPTLDGDDVEAENYPNEVIEGAALHASIQAQISKINNAIVDLSGLTLTNVTVPAVPSDASIYLILKPFVSPDAVTIASPGTAPIYSKPLVSITAMPTINDFTFTMVIPTLPTQPNFSYVNVDGVTISSNTWGTIPPAPVFDSSTLTLDYSDFDTAMDEEDIDLAQTHLTKQTERLQEFKANLDKLVSKLSKDKLTFDAESQKVLTAAQLDAQRLIAQGNIEADIDKQNAIQNLVKQVQEYQQKIELYKVQADNYYRQAEQELQKFRGNVDQKLQKVQIERTTDLRKIELDLQNNLNDFNSLLQTYTTSLQKNIKQAEIDLQRNLEIARLKNDVQTQEQIRKADIELQKYRFKLDKYVAELNSYQVQVNKEVQNLTAKFQQKLAESDAGFKKLEALREEWKSFVLRWRNDG